MGLNRVLSASRWMREGFLLLGLFGISACGGSRPADAESGHVISLNPYFRELRSVTVTALGEPRRFLFDTGGGQTIISPALAATLGCEPYGRSVGFRMSGERVEFEICDEVQLELGTYSIDPEPVAVWDVGAVLPDELPPLDGVISLKSFDEELITLDLAGSLLTIETEDSFATRISAMSPVPMRVATGHSGAGIVVYVGADVDTRRVWMQFDTGNILGVQLSPAVVDVFGIQLTADQRATLENQGTVSLESVALTIPGLGFTAIPALVRPLIIDGALSFDFLERWVFGLDLRHKQLWAAPSR